VVDRSLIADVGRELASAANPANARAMQAYMKSAMPYRGVASPRQLRIWKLVFERHPLKDFDAWFDTTLALWRGARYREERYGAIALTGVRRYAPFQTLATVPLYEEIIVTGAWWDYVDVVASRRMGPLLERYPAAISRLMRRWSRAQHLWKRRTAILCQLSLKDRTNVKLLYDCIEPNLNDREFFIRKAIGWALRQYSWVNPGEVRSYVDAHQDRLSPLSQREAMKHIGGTTRPTTLRKASR
jgi:3-methyladenine DNA glycosylase AlkD